MEVLSAGIVIVSVSAWNNLLHLFPARWREHVVHAGVAVAGAAGALWLFTRYDLARGLDMAWVWTPLAVAIATAVVGIAHVVPPVGRILCDRRIVDMSTAGFFTHTLLRIPLLTAVAEEVLFRGVVWFLLERLGGTTTAWIGSSVAFALAHVVVAFQQARREGYPLVRWIASTLASTGGAGLLLGGLRLLTGGIWASVGVHAAFNMIFAFGARSIAARREISG
jgi:uncharacterized protein